MQILYESQAEEATTAERGQADTAAAEEGRATAAVAAKDSGPARAVRPTPEHGIQPVQ